MLGTVQHSAQHHPCIHEDSGLAAWQREFDRVPPTITQPKGPGPALTIISVNANYWPMRGRANPKIHEDLSRNWDDDWSNGRTKTALDPTAELLRMPFGTVDPWAPENDGHEHWFHRCTRPHPKRVPTHTVCWKTKCPDRTKWCHHLPEKLNPPIIGDPNDWLNANDPDRMNEQRWLERTQRQDIPTTYDLFRANQIDILTSSMGESDDDEVIIARSDDTIYVTPTPEVLRRIEIERESVQHSRIIKWSVIPAEREGSRIVYWAGEDPNSRPHPKTGKRRPLRLTQSRHLEMDAQVRAHIAELGITAESKAAFLDQWANRRAFYGDDFRWSYLNPKALRCVSDPTWRELRWAPDLDPGRESLVATDESIHGVALDDQIEGDAEPNTRYLELLSVLEEHTQDDAPPTPYGPDAWDRDCDCGYGSWTWSDKQGRWFFVLDESDRKFLDAYGKTIASPSDIGLDDEPRTFDFDARDEHGRRIWKIRHFSILPNGKRIQLDWPGRQI